MKLKSRILELDPFANQRPHIRTLRQNVESDSQWCPIVRYTLARVTATEKGQPEVARAQHVSVFDPFLFSRNRLSPRTIPDARKVLIWAEIVFRTRLSSQFNPAPHAMNRHAVFSAMEAVSGR